jgi:hypothetical protein
MRSRTTERPSDVTNGVAREQVANGSPAFFDVTHMRSIFVGRSAQRTHEEKLCEYVL